MPANLSEQVNAFQVYLLFLNDNVLYILAFLIVSM